MLVPQVPILGPGCRNPRPRDTKHTSSHHSRGDLRWPSQEEDFSKPPPQRRAVSTGLRPCQCLRQPRQLLAQIAIPQVERMPTSAPFRMRDWRQVAIDLDAMLRPQRQGPHMPLVWIDKTTSTSTKTPSASTPPSTIPAGPIENKGQYHCALCDMPASSAQPLSH